MSFSSGVFTLVAGNPVVTGTTISSTWANNTLTDIATGLSTCVLKDGTQTITANIPMAGFKLTGLGAGSVVGNSVRYEQLYTTTALTDQATVSWDTSLAPVGTLTLGGSRTMAAPTGGKAGGLYGLIVTQDGTGGRTITWNAVFKGQGGGTMPQPETTAAAVTAFVFYSPEGTNFNCVQCTPFIDSNYIVRGSADPTKKLRIAVGGLTTLTTRVWTAADLDISLGKQPTRQTLASGSGTYTTPSGATRIYVRAVGAGGGGGGNGAGAGGGGTGGNTTFSTLAANGAAGGSAGSTGGAGGSASNGSVNLTGGTGASGNSSVNNIVGGMGASSPFGGAGSGGSVGGGGGGAAANTGSGGGGAGGSASQGASGGGGAGGYCEVTITAPSATYSYAVGASGSAGSGGAGGNAGGAGGTGYIIVDEYYN